MKNSMTFSILIKEEEDYFLAHCLELDIVATSDSISDVKDDILSLIKTQIEYAFRNNNLDNLFKPAPQETWKEFYSCTEAEEEEIPIESSAMKDDLNHFVPSWLVAKTCTITSSRYYA